MILQKGIQDYFLNIQQHRIYFNCRYLPESKEVILFIHGLGCSSDSFRNLFDNDYFPDKSLLVIDLPGFGKSSKPENFSYSMEDQAVIIEQLFMLLPEWDIHIVAHSMGGAIALLFSDNFFSRIKSFANVEGNLVSEDCGMLSRGIANITYEEYKTNLYLKHLSECQNHQQLRFEESTPLAIHKSAVSLVQLSDGGELLNKFKNLKCKKSYFYGDQNKEMPVINRLDFVSKFMISGSGHGMITENPKEFYSVLSEFIYS
ncbi:MAG: alpha/beta fold hydrolase [Ignavibacteriales bacterium]|nr:MAG: alpha/beta fold hydrolase [Ignavibacteriales bacterium]